MDCVRLQRYSTDTWSFDPTKRVKTRTKHAALITCSVKVHEMSTEEGSNRFRTDGFS